MKNIAIILAAGQGKRMDSTTKKQFLLIKEKTVLQYSVEAFIRSDIISEIIIVTSADEMEDLRREYCNGLTSKPCHVVEGGKERYHSVYHALKAIEECDYVFIHDAARPFITDEILTRSYEAVLKYRACVTGVPSKDTVKIASADGYVEKTPDRNKVWVIQTPQVFSYSLIRQAYESLISQEEELSQLGITITDDAMVAERFTDVPVKLVEGDYHNIKITTPEDIELAEVFCRSIYGN